VRVRVRASEREREVAAPNADRDVLILLASAKRAPLLIVLLTLSDPARSTISSFERTVRVYEVVVDLCKPASDFRLLDDLETLLKEVAVSSSDSYGSSS